MRLRALGVCRASASLEATAVFLTGSLWRETHIKCNALVPLLCTSKRLSENIGCLKLSVDVGEYIVFPLELLRDPTQIEPLGLIGVPKSRRFTRLKNSNSGLVVFKNYRLDRMRDSHYYVDVCLTLPRGVVEATPRAEFLIPSISRWR